MLTNATTKYFEGLEADECDCPACLPACERTGKKCFIECDRCKGRIEARRYWAAQERNQASPLHIEHDGALICG